MSDNRLRSCRTVFDITCHISLVLSFGNSKVFSGQHLKNVEIISNKENKCVCRDSKNTKLKTITHITHSTFYKIYFLMLKSISEICKTNKVRVTTTEIQHSAIYVPNSA